MPLDIQYISLVKQCPWIYSTYLWSNSAPGYTVHISGQTVPLNIQYISLVKQCPWIYSTYLWSNSAPGYTVHISGQTVPLDIQYISLIKQCPWDTEHTSSQTVPLGIHYIPGNTANTSDQMICTPRNTIHISGQTALGSTVGNNDTGYGDRVERRNSRFLRSPHRDANYLQHVRSSVLGSIACNTSSSYHVQHAVWHVVRRNSSPI